MPTLLQNYPRGCRGGVYTALVTPFRETKSGTEIDYEAVAKLIDQQVRWKFGLVILGTTGESPTIEPDERKQFTDFCLREARSQVPVIVGTGSNSTRKALNITKQARDQGADGALNVVPYYNKPTKAGLEAHFTTIAQSVPDLPQILYDIPSRCGVGMNSDTINSIIHQNSDNVVGLKWASGDIEQLRQVADANKDNKNFHVFSGDDNRTLEAIQNGAHGVISVLSNLTDRVNRIVANAIGNINPKEARRIHKELLPLMEGCSLQTNPLPIKTALAARGNIQEVFRLPMCPMDEPLRSQWIATLRDEGMLE